MAIEYKSSGGSKEKGKEEGQVIQIQSKGQERLFPKKYARALTVIMVFVAVIVNSANAPPVKVILVAQVGNLSDFLNKLKGHHFGISQSSVQSF